MKEHPRKFDSAMVQAILSGKKTQDRQILSPGPEWVRGDVMHWNGKAAMIHAHRSPFGKVGDRLWVRETWTHHVQAIGASCDEEGPFVYAADGEFACQQRLCAKWKSSTQMPRYASRILLEVVGVRVERLQDISEEDARAEGVSDAAIQSFTNTGLVSRPAAFAYRDLWLKNNSSFDWAANPWAWVCDFRRLYL
jgi:hypothetical protein